MKQQFILGILILFSPLGQSQGDEKKIPLNGSLNAPLGTPGQAATYHVIANGFIPGSVVKTFILSLGSLEEEKGMLFQWLDLHAVKANGEQFRVWILTDRYPPAGLVEAQKTTARYLVQEGNNVVYEFRNQFTGEAVLPCLGAWKYLFPQALVSDSSNHLFPKESRLLGKSYLLDKIENVIKDPQPTKTQVLELLPDALIGVPINTRPKDDTRRYDESDYEYNRLTRMDFDEMIDAGMNCFRVDAEQAGWLEHRNVFYWGIGGNDLRYPESLYHSNYLGPLLFLDEPAVCTRDSVIRPRLKADHNFRKTITPQIVFQEFQKYFEAAQNRGNPTVLLKGLAERSDVDIGDMNFLQQNLYTWETMESTALYQLNTGKNLPPSAFVFEPPGHFGTLRTLPEMNMAYQCQIPVDNPKNLIDMIYGFLRGGARYTNKAWGTSIYGAVDRTDAFWYLTHAYDLGAQLFFFWNSSQLACVPYRECLALSRNLRAHIESHPQRDLQKLKQAAEAVILLPVGYNLGHVYMGKGNLWGLGELNLERINSAGMQYRTVMCNFFTEIERCIRLGVAYDLLWDLEGIQLSGYREIVRIKEDGKVEVTNEGKRIVYDGPRVPCRPQGISPQIVVDLSPESGKVPLTITARAILTEGSSPIYYTLGANSKGICKNVKVFWELYGPEAEDYRFLLDRNQEVLIQENSNQTLVENKFTLKKSGRYRLRVATCDLAGRNAVVWKNIQVEN